MAKKFTHLEFREKLNKNLKAHEKYKGSKKKILIECLICKDKRKKIPVHLLSGEHHCINCGPEKTAIKRRFDVKKLDKILKDKNLERQSPFKNKRTAVKIKCLNCDTTFIRKSNVTKKLGCKTCHMIQLGKSKTLTKKVVNEILKKKSIKLLSVFTGIMHPGNFKCLECKYEWKTKRFDGALYVNKGCARCSKRYNGAYSMNLFIRKPHLKKIRGITYFIKCRDNKEVFYKIGITKQKWNERMRKIPYKTEKIFTFEGFLPYCTKLEIKIKKDFKKFRYEPNKYFAGMAECLKINNTCLKKIKNSFNEIDVEVS